jgi:hypothetical protein
VAILCYEITGTTSPNQRSTTGAEDGHIGAVLKTDHEDAGAQLYSEIAANRLATFLGIPVLIGVPARRSHETTSLRFAALRAVEAGLDIYDFTDEDRTDGDGDGDADVETAAMALDLPIGVYRKTGHVRAIAALCQKYPFEAAAIAVFDLWIGNEDRALNFKAQIGNVERGVIFALDQGSSLLSCRSTVDTSLAWLERPNYPTFHPFQKLVNGRYCGGMVERITTMPDWSIEAATVFQDTVGNVVLPDQYACYEMLQQRKALLGELVDRVLL